MGFIKITGMETIKRGRFLILTQHLEVRVSGV